VATFREDGTPQLSPIWYEYEDGVFYLWVGANTVKVRNLRREPRLSLLIANHDEPYKYVVAEGECEITTEGVLERSTSMAVRYYGEERGRAYAKSMADTNHLLLVLKPSKLLSESEA
jgi:PPOX class probable F420-dependent enzyme